MFKVYGVQVFKVPVDTVQAIVSTLQRRHLGKVILPILPNLAWGYLTCCGMLFKQCHLVVSSHSLVTPNWPREALPPYCPCVSLWLCS